MRMRSPFKTSFGTTLTRDVVITRMFCDGVEGWGELVAGEEPLYNEETVETAVHVMRAHLLPLILGRTFSHPKEVATAWAPIRRNLMAKAALELAFWDAWSKAQGISLSAALGGDKQRVPTGVSIGIQPTVRDLLGEIDKFLDLGYRRIKIKIEPSWDVDVVSAVRDAFGNIPLTVDGNSAYTFRDIDHLRRLDDFGLVMIEQPLAEEDIVDHARLQALLATPICLDESVLSAEGARRALELGSCRIVNVKVGRVGGHREALALHELCSRRGVPLWCGGMLESGIGRLHNIALASLPGFTMPGDTSASDRYWEQDIIEPSVVLSSDGTVEVPVGPGIGYRVRAELIEKLKVDQQSFSAPAPVSISPSSSS
jgi:O-succinylbenzoate synthase